MTATLTLLLGCVLVFLAVALALSIVGVATAERRGVARSLEAVNALDRAPQEVLEELERPFSERVIAPLGDRLVTVGRRITRAETAERLAHKLDVAGNPRGWDVNRLIGLKVLGLGGMAGIAVFYCLGLELPAARVLLFTAVAGAFGYVLPNLLLHNAGQKREQQMQDALADSLDLLTISVEAGLGFDAAVARVAKNTPGPLAGEFTRLLQEMQLGVGRTAAMRAVAERTTLADLKSFCLAMVQADALGIPIARVLRVQSSEMRVKRRQRAEEAAQKVPVKILFPLIFFILPCIFIVVLGPALMSMAGLFGES